MKSNVFICPHCGESTAKRGKGVVNKDTLMDNPPSALRATSPAGGEVNGGFTLIELLVVVLIIGILAAVALPQYQKAVAKSRATQAVTMLQALTQAQEAYYLANNSYTTDLNALDISVPAELQRDTSENAEPIPLSTSNNTYLFSCHSGRSCGATAFNPNLPYFEFALTHQPPEYTHYSNIKWCVAIDRIGSSQIAKDICRSIGTFDHEGDENGGGYYIIN